MASPTHVHSSVPEHLGGLGLHTVLVCWLVAFCVPGLCPVPLPAIAAGGALLAGLAICLDTVAERQAVARGGAPCPCACFAEPWRGLSRLLGILLATALVVVGGLPPWSLALLGPVALLATPVGGAVARRALASRTGGL